MHSNKLLAMIVLFTTISGCVGISAPNLVDKKQDGDCQLTCKFLESEYRHNTEIAISKIRSNNVADIMDITLDILIFPGIGDNNNSSGYEGNALLNRNAWLKELAQEKKCDTSLWVEQPERY